MHKLKFIKNMMKYNTPFLFILIVLSLPAKAQTDFEVVKQRVVSEVMKTQVDDDKVSEVIGTMKQDGSWPGINYNDVSLTGFDNTIHLNNIVMMSLAFNNTASKYFKNKKVKNLINTSFRFWCEKDFISDNWWHNQIFTPQSLTTVLLIMDDNIDPQLIEQALPIIDRAHLDAPGARPGGDRIKIGGIAAKKCLAVGDEVQFRHIIKALNDEIKFSTGNRGMQHDYSFHHRVDRVNTTYSYGLGYAAAFAEWVAYVAKTKYAFEEDKLEHFIDYYLDGICKQMVYGMYIDKGVMNRSISREENFRPRSPIIPEKLMKATDYRREDLEEIIKLRGGTVNPSTSFCKFFWQSEHFVCQRPGFYTSVRMYSRRNRNMEQPYNSEGLLNHHRGDGTNHISITGEEYVNIWPTYDWQKIPGTTVLQKPELIPGEGIQKDGLTDFVGAVTDGLYGAAAFDFISPHDFIKARKAWFFFDDEYVCLGAGIESTSGFPVVTTMDQSLLKGDITVSDEDQAITLPKGEHEINQVNWVHHNGIGYIFPEPNNIYVSNDIQNGSWFDINKQWNSSKEVIKNEVFKLWIDHGVWPQGRRGGLNHTSMVAKDVKYQYIVVPNSALKDMSEDRGIEILANNRFIQGVMNRNLGIVQIIFYNAGEIKFGENMKLSIDSPGAVMIRLNGSDVKEISAADPSRKLSRIHISLSGEINIVGKDNIESVYDSRKNVTDLAIDLPQGVYAGKSVNIEF